MSKQGETHHGPTKSVLIPADIRALGAAGMAISGKIRSFYAKQKADTEKRTGGQKTI